MSIKKTDVLGNLVYAAVSMSCASEIPGYNGSLFAISDDIKERIESDLTEAYAAVAELIRAASQGVMDGTGRIYFESGDKVDSLRRSHANIGETK